MHFMHDVLENFIRFKDRPLYKHCIDQGPSNYRTWNSISYSTYFDDLVIAAGYWTHQLQNIGVQKSDVVGLWITGSLYSDLVHLYAIIRAGFVPQVFNLGMLAQGSPMVEDLLRISAGKALVHDGYFTSHLHATSLPTAIIPDIATLRKISRCRLDDLPLVDDEAVAMIFHTSGTTSGRPKPVPQTHRWLKCQSKVNWPGAWQGGDLDIQKCFNNLGSFGNVGSATAINYLAPSGQCIIQTSRPDFDAAELLAMVREGLNNILLYANWLSKLLAIARSDNQVLDALCSVQQIAYTGEALNPEDLRWALENNIPLTVIYATTETAICLVSDLHDPQTLPSMRLIDGMDCEFLPRCMDEQEQLFDLFVPSGAGNCPHARVRNRPDGHITGDLFEATRHGYYIFRGRNDDWIKTGTDYLLLCDTKAIEDNVKLTCADIVQNCVVVGSYKPIILFVEPSRSFANNAEGDSGALKDQLLKRMEEFNKSRFMHERIDSPLRIVVVSAGSLPRTKEKGNIRRKAVEEAYSDILQVIYSQLEGTK